MRAHSNLGIISPKATICGRNPYRKWGRPCFQMSKQMPMGAEYFACGPTPMNGKPVGDAEVCLPSKPISTARLHCLV